MGRSRRPDATPVIRGTVFRYIRPFDCRGEWIQAQIIEAAPKFTWSTTNSKLEAVLGLIVARYVPMHESKS
jgi:hypothetical protein